MSKSVIWHTSVFLRWLNRNKMERDENKIIQFYRNTRNYRNYIVKHISEFLKKILSETI